MTDQDQITVFDRRLVRAHRDRAAPGFSAHAPLFEHVGEQIMERLADIRQEFHNALDLGAHQGLLARMLAAKGIPLVVAADISGRMIEHADGACVVADEEFLPFAPSSFDLIASNLSLHWVNDLPGALIQIRKALRPRGLFLAALAGGGSLYELRNCLMEAELKVTGGVSPRLSPMIELQTASGLLQRAGFVLPVTDLETVTLDYPDMVTLMRDLRGMGETNALFHRARFPARRQIFTEAARLYRERFDAGNGRIPAAFEIVFLHGSVPG